MTDEVLKVGSVVLGVEDVERAVRFWSAALDYCLRDEPDHTWAVLIPNRGQGVQIALQLSETPVQEHPRVHLDLYAEDQATEVERLVSLGARRVEWDLYPDGADFVVLADPDGNRFCVIDKRPE